jgi:hypothetical protein
MMGAKKAKKQGFYSATSEQKIHHATTGNTDQAIVLNINAKEEP